MKILMAEYNSDWPAMFTQEQAALLQSINIDGAIIEHIGSTSVAGLAAKPIIDVIGWPAGFCVGRDAGAASRSVGL